MQEASLSSIQNGATPEAMFHHLTRGSCRIWTVFFFAVERFPSEKVGSATKKIIYRWTSRATYISRSSPCTAILSKLGMTISSSTVARLRKWGKWLLSISRHMFPTLWFVLSMHE
jgi:hypothetical protein